MEDFEEDIRRHNLAQQIRIGDQFAEFSLVKGGFSAQEGEIREWQGKKMQKVGGRWVPVPGSDSKPEKQKAPLRVKDIPKENGPKGEEFSLNKINRHEKAKLKSIKSLYSSDPSKAYGIAESLSDEAKNVIPQKVWDTMMSSSLKKEEMDGSRNSSTAKVSGNNKDVIVIQRVEDSENVNPVQKVDIENKK